METLEKLNAEMATVQATLDSKSKEDEQKVNMTAQGVSLYINEMHLCFGHSCWWTMRDEVFNAPLLIVGMINH